MITKIQHLKNLHNINQLELSGDRIITKMRLLMFYLNEYDIKIVSGMELNFFIECDDPFANDEQAFCVICEHHLIWPETATSQLSHFLKLAS